MTDTEPYKRLWRSRTDRKIAGVCGGLAEFFRIDPVWIRLIFLVFFLAGGAAFIVYIILWILVPLQPLGRDRQDLDKPVR